MNMPKRRKGAPRPDGVMSGERYVGLGHYTLDSQAWAALSGAAVKLLLAVMRRYNGVNNGEIAYSVREAQRIGLKRSAAAAAFDELIRLGFLAVERDSAFGVKTRMARLWRITSIPVGDKKATKDFMRWQPGAAPPSKFKTQSAEPDTRSANTDSSPSNATILPPTVRPEGLSGSKSDTSQSAQPDTYRLPGGGISRY
jgi:hypothetical protein